MRPASPRWGLLLLCAWMALSGTARAVEARIGSNENFNVLASTPELMRWALVRCNELRREIALEWLGEELPPGAGYAHLHIEVCQDRDCGQTMPMDPKSGRKTLFWVTCPAEHLEGTLAHEMVHVVFAHQFPEGMPIWANEGIASRYDDPGRKRIRQELMRHYAPKHWPSVEELLGQPQGAIKDQYAYALSEAIVDYFLRLGSRERFVQFVSDSRSDLNGALWEHYRIANVKELEQRLVPVWSAQSVRLASSGEQTVR